ncbi:MAG: ATP-dependent DNA helicase [Lachnospiraceae bacterium]|jgi:DNA excision repair protein ERCC-2
MSQDSNTVIRISVRNLVEFVLRSGDLDNRKTAGSQKEAMQAGSRLHRKIQKKMGAGYQAEVPLKHQIQEEGFLIQVEGRADGILTEPSGVTIDEIKCMYMDVNRLEEAVPVHMAQAACYGYLYGLEHSLSSICIQITYCNIETEEIRRFRKEWSWEELSQWFSGLIHEYVKWAEYLYHNAVRRTESIKDLEFPYPYRKGQKELAVSVYKSIARERNLFIQAPTGIGKTLSCVYPALKAMGEEKADKLFYLTAKTITRTVAEETFQILREKGLYLKSVTITAKEKLCFQEKLECNPDACPYAKGHYDRVNDAVFDIIHQEFGITRETVLQYARQYQVCPFEFCLDITNWTDAIICDYNYVFDPDVKLKRYFAEGNATGKYLFLVDEAHNLVGRAREMYSAGLKKEDVLLVKRIFHNRSEKIKKLLDACNRDLLTLKRECTRYEILPSVDFLMLHIRPLFEELEKYLDEHPEFEDRDLVLDFYFNLRAFLYVQDRLDDHYQIYTELLPSGEFLLRLFCVNPAKNLKECMAQAVSTIFFSATLLPVPYYKELLSGDKEEYAVYANSPFPGSHKILLVATEVSSRYSRRNQREYEKTSDYIEAIVNGKQGNYLVFCPSYQYMREIESILRSRWENEPEYGSDGRQRMELLVQSPNMTEQEKEEFLAEFDKSGRSMAALCVIGGAFSEGIDLRGEKLIGVVIIGTGLPMVCTEQEILKGYFDEKEEKGFDYAYQYPGMNKVMQAAGRLIRTMEDRGVIALLDDRFLQADYQSLFPREWDEYYPVSRNQVNGVLERFWKEV